MYYSQAESGFSLKHQYQRIVLLIVCLLLFIPFPLLLAETFKIASYNVENLFDLEKDGGEYTGYIPDTGYGWNEETATVKYRNIARVISDINPSIIGLQEVESERALKRLQQELRQQGCEFPYDYIADNDSSTVHCAILSKYPFTETAAVPVKGGIRDILKAVVDIQGNELIIFVNHWKSKRGAESMRINYAKALRRQVNDIPADRDVVLMGDFNSSYNEFRDFRDNPRLNDTDGKTGINHILNTVTAGELVDEEKVQTTDGHDLFYNLWLEYHEEYRRWSHNFFGEKTSLDSFMISSPLYDEEGISYVDNSFRKFNPDYLFNNRAVYRWQRAKSGRGKHAGEGYSDHLPIYAELSTDPFSAAMPPPEQCDEDDIASLYHAGLERINYRLKDCVVVYKHQNNAVIKRPGDRAIFVYKAASGLEAGKVYDITVRKLYDFYGLREITILDNVTAKGEATDLEKLYLNYKDQDLSRQHYQNEVIRSLTGKYRRGQLFYGKNKRIKLYFTNDEWRPENNTRVRLEKVRISHYRQPQLSIEKKEQLQAE